MFFKVGVLKNLAIFPGKHLPQDLQFYLKKTPTQVFSCDYCEIFKSTFFIEHLRWLLLREPVQCEISVAMWRDYKSETLLLFPWIPP